MRRALAASLLPAVAGLLALMASSAQLAASSPAAQKRFVGEVRAGDADTQAEEELWWHNAVIYQVYPRSFQDSDGDGIGDIKGITSRLAYLKEIGVGAVWLSPFYPSPQADFGYDISDFKNVDPQYGTLADFQEMVTTAHNLGMKVVADLVPNHSSDEHDWFIKSVAREAPYTDYYVWRDGKTDAAGNRIPPNNWVSHFRFSAWEWNEKRQQYYLHQFAVKQPDLNYDNANVVQEMKDVYTFWMDQGVDGFRVDALPFLFEEKYEEDEPLKENPSPNEDANDYSYYEHPNTMDKEGTYDMLQQWRKVVDSHPDGKPRVIMTECYTDFQNTIKYYGTKDNPGAHFTFNFQFISYLDASKGPAVFKQLIDQWMEAMEDWRKPNWVIGNHDNKRVETRFPNMADAMNMISLSLPGTAMTYYGEELGMSDAFISWEQTKDPQAVNAGQERYLQTSRDPCRTPMQWDGSVSAGFSKNPLTWMPTNPNYYNLNVEKERDDKRSHMNVYKALTTARQSITMRKGDYTATVIGDNVLMIQRSYPQSDTYLTIANVGSWEQEVKTSDLPAGTWSVYVSSGNSRLTAGSAVTSLSLRPKEAIILTNAAVSTTAPQTTTAPVGRSSTVPATVTSTQSSSGFAVRAVASLSIVLPLLCLRG